MTPSPTPRTPCRTDGCQHPAADDKGRCVLCNAAEVSEYISQSNLDTEDHGSDHDTDLTVDLTRATTAELIQANHRGRQALTAARATRRPR